MSFSLILPISDKSDSQRPSQPFESTLIPIGRCLFADDVYYLHLNFALGYCIYQPQTIEATANLTYPDKKQSTMENSPSSTFDHSPAESFLSAPGDTYPSLFAATTPSVDSSTMNPMDMMTPQSTDDDKSQLRLSPVPEGSDEENKDSDSPRKSGKKRKSWGQVLPEPKTNLPPRKRAKTDDEKEQRRVERVLRNRRAAQSSRERKRVEVEALEKRNEELEEQLQHARNTNIMLAEELHRVRGSSGDVTSSTSPLVPLGNNPVTLSQELFRSQATDSETAKAFLSNLFTPTVNPASLSPELAPVPDSTEALTEETTGNSGTGEQTLSTPADLTQPPAVKLCDLPCQTSAELLLSLPASQDSPSPMMALALQFRATVFSALAIFWACQRPLMSIALSLKGGFSILPSPQMLATIICLVTTPTSSYSTSTTSSTTQQPISTPTPWQRAATPPRKSTSTPWSMTLRISLLHRILSSSPNLARPLMDATKVALRLVSEGCDDRVETMWRESDLTRDDVCELTRCLGSMALPPAESLLTLLWALQLEDNSIRWTAVGLDREKGILQRPTNHDCAVDVR